MIDCKHLGVYRKLDDRNNLTDDWHCASCGARFPRLDGQSGKITIMEPQAALRDQFAMAVLGGLKWSGEEEMKLKVRIAFQVADEALEARKQ